MKEKEIKIFPLHVNDVYNKAGFETIENSLETMQKFVGGLIQYIPLGESGELDLICNDDGKFMKMRPNRAWIIDNQVVDIIAGEAFVCRHDGKGNFCSIREEDKEVIVNTLMPLLACLNGEFAVANPEGKLQIVRMYGEED